MLSISRSFLPPSFVVMTASSVMSAYYRECYVRNEYIRSVRRSWLRHLRYLPFALLPRLHYNGSGLCMLESTAELCSWKCNFGWKMREEILRLQWHKRFRGQVQKLHIINKEHKRRQISNGNHTLQRTFLQSLLLHWLLLKSIKLFKFLNYVYGLTRGDSCVYKFTHDFRKVCI